MIELLMKGEIDYSWDRQTKVVLDDGDPLEFVFSRGEYCDGTLGHHNPALHRILV